LRDVTVDRFAAIGSTGEAIKAMQLSAAISNYGPLAAAAWTLIQVIKAIRHAVAARHHGGSDHEQLDLVAIHPRGDLR
jgi:hypothetical protein